MASTREIEEKVVGFDLRFKIDSAYNINFEKAFRI